ncbi:hypothetical protein ACWOAH_02345 [Vagococcus vulneris]|uniref:DNA-directed RNA polymerase beta subunit n=1 Tax=Vagococcus vulneris TaxID=1977869 RepID=A0A430A126_9ENTE|nr:hypothetical protein [Vagococcus vulneris]RSU00098.1 hypothetical protein CBF37_02015 [Vagococcus vulneris]
MIRLNDYYKDRGIVKYQGFFLSEHTTSIMNEESDRNLEIFGKEQMSEEQIMELIERAIMKQQRISVQLNLKDMTGNFMEDISGMVLGYEDGTLYLDDAPIMISQIRHVEMEENKVWYDF